MAYNIFASNPSAIYIGSRNVIATVDSVDAAKAIIFGMFSNMFIEEDQENPDHFDVMAYNRADSKVFSIEPVKG